MSYFRDMVPTLPKKAAVSRVMCLCCAHTWLAIHESGQDANKFECPRCHKQNAMSEGEVGKTFAP